MEYYVIRESFNTKCFEKYNIFQHGIVAEDVERFKKEYLKHKIDRDELIKQLNMTFMYCFWSKCEYEMVISPWCGWAPEEKIDVYYQLKDNIPLIADMLIHEWKKKPSEMTKEEARDVIKKYMDKFQDSGFPGPIVYARIKEAFDVLKID